MTSFKPYGVVLAVLTLLLILLHSVAYYTAPLRAHNKERTAIEQLTRFLPQSLIPDSDASAAITTSPLLLNTHTKALSDKAPMLSLGINDTKYLLIPIKEPSGFVDAIHCVVALDAKGAIQKVSVNEHRETLGFVSAYNDFPSTFLQQFAGFTLIRIKQSFTLKSDGGSLDYITGATVSSRAVKNCVQAALTLAEEQGFLGVLAHGE